MRRFLRPLAALFARAPAASETPPTAMDAFAELRRHAVIGWDLDMTLLGHPAAAAMHDFIRATPDIRHLIVTFRANGTQERIWSDLAAQPHSAGPTSFAAVLTIDDALASGFQRLHRHRAAGLYAGPHSPTEIAYLSWKGQACASWGASVLIDDMTEHVSLGCTTHGIELRHPDVFRF
jgi:hypothetical protein